jgi:hypothetical protein
LESGISSTTLKNIKIISDPTLISKSSENTNIIYSLTTNSTYLANKEIISQTTQISISFDNEENNFKGFLNVSFYVILEILVVLLISNSTFIYLYRKR